MFIARDYDASIRLKLHSYFAAKFGRKDFLRSFCTSNSIDYNPRSDRRYILPEQYLIEHAEIKYLSDVRDKLILSFYDDYKKEQKDNIVARANIANHIETQDAILNVCKSRLAKNQALLKKAKTSIDQIHYEHMVESIKTKMKNERKYKNELKYESKQLEAQFAGSIQNWNKQIEIIEKMFDHRLAIFEKNISKLVRKKFNYADFYACYGDYSDEVKKVLKGELYE